MPRSATARALSALLILALAAAPHGLAQAPSIDPEQSPARTFYLPLGGTAPMREHAPTREDPYGIETTVLEHGDAPYVRATDRFFTPLLVALDSTFELHLADREAIEPADSHTTRVEIAVQRRDGSFLQNPDGSVYLLGEATATVPASSATSGVEGWSEFRFSANDAGVLARQGDMLVVPVNHRLVLSFSLVVAPGTEIVVPGDGRTAGEFYRDSLDGAWGAFVDAFPAPVEDLGRELGAGSITQYLGYWVDTLDGSEDVIDAGSRPYSVPPAARFRTGAVDAASWLRVATTAPPPTGEVVHAIGFEDGASGWFMPPHWGVSDGCLGAAEGSFSLQVPRCGTTIPLLSTSISGYVELPFPRGSQHASIEYSFRGTDATLPPRGDLAFSMACPGSVQDGVHIRSWTSNVPALADLDGDGSPEAEAPTEWTRYVDAIPACQGGKIALYLTFTKHEPSPRGTELFAIDGIVVRAS